MSKALTAQQFTRYAWTQIRAAEASLTNHRATASACACGRPTPCPQAESLHRTRQHYLDRLGLTTPTQPLVVLPATPPARRPSWRRRLAALITVGARHGSV